MWKYYITVESRNSIERKVLPPQWKEGTAATSTSDGSTSVKPFYISRLTINRWHHGNFFSCKQMKWQLTQADDHQLVAHHISSIYLNYLKINSIIIIKGGNGCIERWTLRSITLRRLFQILQRDWSQAQISLLSPLLLPCLYQGNSHHIQILKFTSSILE